jgi:hypothetical protein
LIAEHLKAEALSPIHLIPKERFSSIAISIHQIQWSRATYW